MVPRGAALPLGDGVSAEGGGDGEFGAGEARQAAPGPNVWSCEAKTEGAVGPCRGEAPRWGRSGCEGTASLHGAV
eukprot:5857821-Prymnesium_polylepis.1